MKEKILFKRHYLIGNGLNPDKTKAAYYAAYLLSNFGIEVDRPEALNQYVLRFVDEEMHLNVPHSFYSNPQDMKYFTSTELLIEQLVSYLVVECTGNGAIDPEHPEKYDRVEVFKKTLPQYVEGTDIKLRKFNILITEDEINRVLNKIADAYCAYTRPLSQDETEEFIWLYENKYLNMNNKICCKETIFNLLDYDVKFACFLDKKDIVKLSVAKLGTKVDFSRLNDYEKEQLKFIGKIAKFAHNCPLSKKQAKFYNKLIKECKLNEKKLDNRFSPDKLANVELQKGNIVEAAKVYAKNGSMLERRIKMLLSRANPREAIEILDMLPSKNPIALYQMINNLSFDEGGRTFTFISNRLIKTHVETDYEQMWRKSKLNPSTKALLHDEVINKIAKHYQELPALGKIYVSDEFDRVALPINTSASGKGLDVLPTGSRIKIENDYIRTFVRWKGIFDVDADLTALKCNDNLDIKMDRNAIKTMNFINYHSYPFGRDLLFSGDNRSDDGAEYYDINIPGLVAQGYSYIVFGFHGFTSKFNQGETICGYQDKSDLNTKAWDPKNIAFQFKVTGESKCCMAFAIDLKNKELIIINQMVDSNENVASKKDWVNTRKYLLPLDLPMSRIIKNRGELVDDPEDADIVFDRDYQPTEKQVAVRPFDIETLVALVNDGFIELPTIEE